MNIVPDQAQSSQAIQVHKFISWLKLRNGSFQALFQEGKQVHHRGEPSAVEHMQESASLQRRLLPAHLLQGHMGWLLSHVMTKSVQQNFPMALVALT